MTPLFSLAVICRNGAPHIVRFLSSVAKQTYDLSKVEVVFVDDGSSDGSDYIAERFGEELPNFKLVRTGVKDGSGCGGARNAALKAATGEYLWHVDIDDWLSEDALERIDKAITSSEGGKVDAVIVPFSTVCPDGKGNNPIVPRKGSIAALATYPVAAWAKVLRREIVLEMAQKVTCQDLAWHFLQCDRVKSVAVAEGKTPCYFYNRANKSSVTETIEFLSAHPHTIEQLAYENTLVQKGLKDGVVSDVLRALAEMYDIRNKLKTPEVRAAWSCRFSKVVSNVMSGRFVD